MLPRRRAIAILTASMTTLVLPRAAIAQGATASPAVAQRALAQINAFRAAAGIAPAELHPALMVSALGHVDYYDRNQGAGMAGMGLHEQAAGRPGFTGATMAERAQAAGYASRAVTENAGFGSLQAAIEWGMSTVNHRLPLIHPSALDLGVAESSRTGFNIIAVGLRGGFPDATLPSIYPAHGATGVPTTWDGGEAPNPAPGIPRPLGFPITICFRLGQKVEWQFLELRGPDGRVLETSPAYKAWMSAAAIIPHRPLLAGATHRVRVVAMVDGVSVTREVSFTTRAA